MKLSKKGKGGKDPRTVTLAIDFYKRADGRIGIGTNDPEGAGFKITVSEVASKPDGHPGLYKRLDRFLKMKGALDVSAK